MAKRGEGSDRVGGKDRGKEQASAFSSSTKTHRRSTTDEVAVVVKHAQMIRELAENFDSLIFLNEENDLVKADPSYFCHTLERVTNVEARNLHSSSPTHSVQGEFGVREIYPKDGVASSSLGTSAMLITEQRRTKLSLSFREAQAAPNGQEILAAYQFGSSGTAKEEPDTTLKQGPSSTDPPHNLPIMKRKRSTESTDDSHDEGVPSASNNISIREQQPSSERPTKAQKGNLDGTNHHLSEDPPHNLLMMKRKRSTESTDGVHDEGAPSASNNINIREQQPSSERPIKAQKGNLDDTGSDADSSFGKQKEE